MKIQQDPIMNQVNEFSDDQLVAVHDRLTEIMLEYVSEEDYERAAIVRDSKQKVSDLALGYDDDDLGKYVVYKLVSDEGEPIDAYVDRGDYVITFGFSGMYYRFWIVEFDEYLRFKNQIIKNRKNKK
jgi:hypothetical protein